MSTVVNVYRSGPEVSWSPYQNIQQVTPSDTARLPNASRAIYFATAGNVNVLTMGGQRVDVLNVLAGTIYPICAVQVFATGTTATGILALW